MSNLGIVLAVAAITFISRISFLARPVSRPPITDFLEVFPVALFVSLAGRDLLAPEGTLVASPFPRRGAGSDRRRFRVSPLDARSGWGRTCVLLGGTPAFLNQIGAGVRRFVVCLSF